MNRRELLRAMGTLTLLSVAAEAGAAARSGNRKLRLDESYFLSKENPLATVDQRELEAEALQVMQSAEVGEARKNVELQWRAAAGRNVSGQARALFDDMVTEYVFLNVLKAVNSDPNYPKILGMVFAPPHEWFGMRVPGSRVAGPNPDNSYRQIPIAADAHYELLGQCLEPSPEDFTFTLMNNLMFTRRLPILEKRDLTINRDGSFAISLGPETANGRSNHLQLPPDTRWLFIRDSRSDWRQIPNALRIQRLDPPTRAPLTARQIAERAAAFMVDDLPNSYWWLALASKPEVNTMTQPSNTGGVGGLASQATSFGRAVLSDDEALIVTVGHGGAAYHSLSLYDCWYRTIDPAKHMSSLTNSQAMPNADGTITHLISTRDPGAYNWLDAAGQHELLILHRWQGLARDRSAENRLSITTKLTKLDDLDALLPAGTRRVTENERRMQLAERLASYQLRFKDH